MRKKIPADRNELSNTIEKDVIKILERWKKKYPHYPLLETSQQLYLAGGIIREMGLELQEEYRRGSY